MNIRQRQKFFLFLLIGVVTAICNVARASSLVTIVGCCSNVPSSDTLNFTSAEGQSTVTYTGTGHINGPTDLGAYMMATYTNYAPGSQGDFYYFFGEQANFSDIVTVTGSTAPVFNFTLAGTTTASNIDYANAAVSVWFTECLTTLCGAGLQGVIENNQLVFNSSNTFFGPGQYQLYIRLQAQVCFVGCTGFTPATGSNLSGTSNYNDTLALDSVTLGPGETMIGQSGINYGTLNSSATPEPGSMVLLLAGLLAAGVHAFARGHRDRTKSIASSVE